MPGDDATEGHCVALATFGTPADADILAAYLDRYLPRPDLYYNRTRALGVLLHLDTKLGSERATRFLTPEGLWEQWTDGPPGKERCDPEQYRRHIGDLCAFAEEAARHCVARN
ncbi:DUF6000 family protein [Kitasatospora sp. NPDC004669]|uniref:DUF6000 family protein n=1 Tax=Kitasatospora sp. NPDC004669 TaxID=3154555 RepID=UPI0033B5DD7B